MSIPFYLIKPFDIKQKQQLIDKINNGDALDLVDSINDVWDNVFELGKIMEASNIFVFNHIYAYKMSEIKEHCDNGWIIKNGDTNKKLTYEEFEKMINDMNNKEQNLNEWLLLDPDNEILRFYWDSMII